MKKTFAEIRRQEEKLPACCKHALGIDHECIDKQESIKNEGPQQQRRVFESGIVRDKTEEFRQL